MARFNTVLTVTGLAMEESQRQLTLDRFLAERQRRAFITAELSTRDREAALDIVQDSMLAFVRRYATKPAVEWGPLFQRVLQNRIVDWHRRQKVHRALFGWFRPAAPGDGQAHDPLDQAAAPARRETEQVVSDEAATDAVIDAIARLPLRQQQAVLLRVWEGLDTAATARAMGCSGGSVKTHLSRALASLRRELEEHYDH